jgi:hypothetical protein
MGLAYAVFRAQRPGRAAFTRRSALLDFNAMETIEGGLILDKLIPAETL